MTRCKHEILLDILGYIREQPRKATHILQRCNLSSHMLRSYLQMAVGMGLVMSDNGFFRITENGHRILQILMTLKG